MEEALRTKDVKSLVQLMKAFVRTSESDETSQNTTDEQNLLALKAILTSSVAEIGRLITQASKEEALKGGSGGEAYTVIADAQLIEPRGRFTVSLSSEGMLLDGKSTTCFVPWEKISHCACLPSNLSTKKEGEELLAFLLAEPVKYCNKEIKTLLWSLGKSRAKLTHALLPGSLTPMDGTEHEVVATLVAALCKKKIATPRKELFQSVTMQRPYLKCYRGIQEGALYPLKNGLIFLKPLLFIPTESIASLTAGRGGSGSTRYIDLMIETLDETTHEFTNIAREELLAIQIYVTEFLAIRKRAEAAKIFIKDESGVKVEVKAEVEDKHAIDDDEDDDDDESDEDFDPDAVDEDASGIDSDDSRYSDGEGGLGGNNDADMSDDEGTRNMPPSRSTKKPSVTRKKDKKRVISAESEDEKISPVKSEPINANDSQNDENMYNPNFESPNKKKVKLEHNI